MTFNPFPVSDFSVRFPTNTFEWKYRLLDKRNVNIQNNVAPPQPEWGLSSSGWKHCSNWVKIVSFQEIDVNIGGTGIFLLRFIRLHFIRQANEHLHAVFVTVERAVLRVWRTDLVLWQSRYVHSSIKDYRVWIWHGKMHGACKRPILSFKDW